MNYNSACIILGLIGFVQSCNPGNENGAVDSISNGEYYFAFDELDHYSIEIQGSEIWDLAGNDKSPIDTFLFDILVSNEIPASITDTGFITRLPDFGFVKKDVPENDLDSIREIFREKEYTDIWYAMCMPEFRDILVFRDKGKISGIAKICFGCHYQYMVGTVADLDSFGMDNDYRLLHTILDKK